MEADSGELDRFVHEELRCSWVRALMTNETLPYPRPSTTICTVVGEMDMAALAALVVHVTSAPRDPGAHLVIDLSAVTRLGLNGLHLLLDVLENQTDCHPAVVVGQNRQVSLRLKITAVDRFLRLHHHVARALYACLPPTDDPDDLCPANDAPPTADKGCAA